MTDGELAKKCNQAKPGKFLRDHHDRDSLVWHFMGAAGLLIGMALALSWFMEKVTK